MIDALKALFTMPETESETALQHRLHVAAAAMLIETSRADFTEDAQEEAAMAGILRDSLDLEAGEVNALMAAAAERVDESTSLYEFTRTINDHYSAERKLQLIAAMWKVAYADGDLDKYEEALIRRVSELTYVPHEDYIRTKLAAQGKPIHND
ncbi:TerB family tellurite resistance protein [Pseudohalioglobus sediminis]|uniref:TerB family tellurite resistance protein n=1 Tax=Pseudohalioglobus sediminis TaxID=2606449 RepID=A0A5B0X5P8_9GAMM|nr:TerB family tellurite resistance protein [Pseudohalioglobus sediminis]KAA1194005.1 TerB family tellurite resistance protein [Pseudohalioglobus sediminis]